MTKAPSKEFVDAWIETLRMCDASTDEELRDTEYVEQRISVHCGHADLVYAEGVVEELAKEISKAVSN